MSANDYIYDMEAEQAAFVQVPRVLLFHDNYQGISPEAKLLYSLLLDRTGLSRKNGWKDSLNRIYIIFTIDEIREDMHCGKKKAIQLLDELEYKAGLIERKRLGLGKPNLIYVKSLFWFVDNSGARHFLKCQNDTSGGAEREPLEVPESNPNKNKYKNTEMSHIDNSFLPERDSEGMKEINDYEAYFRKQLEFDILLHNYREDRDTINGILNLLVEACTSKKKLTRIAGEEKPTQVVKSRLMKLEYCHIEYVLECLRENTTPVRDMKQYMLTTLYNAPLTMGAYYDAQVRRDMSCYGL